MKKPAEELTKEESELYGERIKGIWERRDELAEAFLAWWTAEARLGALTIAEAFDQWAEEKIATPELPMLPSERGILLWTITHTPEGKTRILLARNGLEDKWTGATEPARREPGEEDLDRLGVGGDLARQHGEALTAWLERIARGFGWWKDGGGVRSMPAADAWLPYKEPEEPAEAGEGEVFEVDESEVDALGNGGGGNG